MELWEHTEKGHMRTGIFMGARSALTRYAVGSTEYLRHLMILHKLAQSIDLSKLDPDVITFYYEIDEIQAEFDLIKGLYELACVDYRDEMLKMKLEK